MSDDFDCALSSLSGMLEWVQVDTWGTKNIGEVPRICIEALGIDCSPLNTRDTSGQITSAVWFHKDQSERLHAHKHYRKNPLQ